MIDPLADPLPAFQNHAHVCPVCGHTWECLGIWTNKQRVRTAATCQRTLGLKTNGGTCDLCYHLRSAEAIAQGRWPNLGERAIFEAIQRLRLNTRVTDCPERRALPDPSP